MVRLIINYFNIIIKFLIETEDYNNIILSKSDYNDELIKIDII